MSRKHRNYTRVAFPHQKGETDDQGEVHFTVSARHYWDQQGRTFTLPASALKTFAEPAGLAFSHAIYCLAEVAVDRGVMGIRNFKQRRRMRRG